MLSSNSGIVFRNVQEVLKHKSITFVFELKFNFKEFINQDCTNIDKLIKEN